MKRQQKDEGAFQRQKFFALCPGENRWQIDAMSAERNSRCL